MLVDRLEQHTHRAAIQSAVALRPWRPNCRSLAPVQHPELHHRKIGGAPHDTAECVHLPNHRALRDAADRRIARHLPDCLERTRHDGDARPQPGGANSCFGAGMARSDDDDVEIGFGGERPLHRRRGRSRHATKLY